MYSSVLDLRHHLYSLVGAPIRNKDRVPQTSSNHSHQRTRTGTVAAVKPFGIFVNIEEVAGLVFPIT